MKNMQFFSCLLFIAMTMHCMEPENSLWKKIDCNAIENSLNTDYNNYLKNRLEEYKKTDFTPQNVSCLTKVGTLITGNPLVDFPYYDIRDEQGNTFIKVAVKKMDLPFVDWHVTKQGAHCITRDDFNACIATCMQYLKPSKTPTETDETTKNTTHEILKILTIKQGDQASIFTLRDKPCRENLIKQLILLQLKHKKRNTTFTIEDTLFTQHLTSGEDDKSPIILSDLYQTVTDKKGNTLSHIIVDLHNADELYELIKKNYVSPAANKSCKTVLDIALNHFQSFIQDPGMTFGDIYPEKINQARCCVFMLLTYIKLKQTGKLPNHQCCNKHVITL